MQKLIGANAAASSPKTAPGSHHDNPATPQDGSENATRHQLVQVVLRDVMRRHGIPPHWIELQMLAVSSRSRGPGLYVRLVAKQWDQRLINHAYALQNTLLADIVRLEPRASDWLQGLSWQLEFGDTCPYPTLPDKSFWLEPVKQATPATRVAQAIPVAQAGQPAQATQEDEALQDLEQLFRIRDQELGKQADRDDATADYEKTQHSPL